VSKHAPQKIFQVHVRTDCLPPHADRLGVRHWQSYGVLGVAGVDCLAANDAVLAGVLSLFWGLSGRLALCYHCLDSLLGHWPLVLTLLGEH